MFLMEISVVFVGNILFGKGQTTRHISIPLSLLLCRSKFYSFKYVLTTENTYFCKHEKNFEFCLSNNPNWTTLKTQSKINSQQYILDLKICIPTCISLRFSFIHSNIKESLEPVCSRGQFQGECITVTHTNRYFSYYVF